MIKQADIQTFVECLIAYEKRSTCARVNVASIIVKESRGVMTGWNGVSPGFRHCESFFAGDDLTSAAGRETHRAFSDRFEHHAEMNAIGMCAKLGISIDGCSIIQTVSPCLYCAKLIKIAGIKEVYYIRDYDRSSDDALSFLLLNQVNVYKINLDEGNVIKSITPITLEETYVAFKKHDGTVYNPKG